MKTPTTRRRRCGATIVEFAFVAMPLFILMYASVEYGRYLMTMHLAGNAARAGARLAAVSTADANNLSKVTDEVRKMMVGLQYNLNGSSTPSENYKVEVFAVDNAGLPDTIKPRDGADWNDAAFNDFIAVRISGTFRSFVPQLLGMSSTYRVEVVGLANSEAN
jgi:hypothetical protein